MTKHVKLTKQQRRRMSGGILGHKKQDFLEIVDHNHLMGLKNMPHTDRAELTTLRETNLKENTPAGGKLTNSFLKTSVVKGKVVSVGGKKKAVAKRHKIFSDATPFGYTKREWNKLMTEIK